MIESMFIHRMTIQQLSTVVDGSGGASETWTNIAVNVPCRIVPLTGFEELQQAAGGSNVALTHRIFCGPNVAVSNTHRLVSGGRMYTIVSVAEPDLMGRFKRIAAVEINESR